MAGSRALIGWLFLGLALAACAGRSEPAEEQELPATKDVAATTPSLTPAEPTASPAPSLAESLEDLGPAPDFTNQVWLNSEAPLTLAALRGKVVLLEFWTFG